MIVITNVSNQTVVADRGELASGWRRMVGLLSRSSLSTGEALIIPRCGAIHTWFMRFTIDAVFLRRGTVVKVAARLPPFRFAWGAAGADTVIELPPGGAAHGGILPGSRLDWRP